MAIDRPAYSQMWVSNELKKDGLFASPGRVRNIWQTHDLETLVAFAKLYNTKTAITAADISNDRMLRFFDDQEIPLLMILTDRGTEYCRKMEIHGDQLYLAIENIGHSKTRARSPQSNGICERFHKTVLNKFYRFAFKKNIQRFKRVTRRS